MLKTTLAGMLLAMLMSSLSIGTNLALPAAPSPEPEQKQAQVQETVQPPVQKAVQEQPVIPEQNTTGCPYCGGSCTYTDGNGNGICDYYENHMADKYNHRHYYADDNNDGICDYCFSSSDCGLHDNCPSGYSGQTQHHHNSGCGNGFRGGHHR